jgi:predicted house-cleaning noncanonical NTP pyrophosphatase (MazG superfamily)
MIYNVITSPVYQYSYDSDFNHLPVKKLLNELKEELMAKQFDDFPALYNQYVYIVQRIDAVGAKEYFDSKSLKN